MLSLFISNAAQTVLIAYQVEDRSLPIVRTTRKNSIALKTRAEGVVLLVPKGLSNKRLQNLLAAQHGWIEQSLKRLEQRRQNRSSVPVFNGSEGQVFEFLGERLRVATVFSEHGRSIQSAEVVIEDGQCLVRLDSSSEVIEDSNRGNQAVCVAIESFMKKQALEYLQLKLDVYAQQIGVTFKSVTIKGYKSRWGSCYSDGRIQFNWRLMQAPTWVIDYVVVHELCHLIHANHSKAFWDLVALHYPQTAAAKVVIKQRGSEWIQLLQS